jgi:hypothetical protein
MQRGLARSIPAEPFPLTAACACERGKGSQCQAFAARGLPRVRATTTHPARASPRTAEEIAAWERRPRRRLSGSLHDVVVVGAGAAGLWAAARAAELGARVRSLEKTPRTGTKVLASGGTRCNLTTTLGPDGRAALFGAARRALPARGLRALPPERVRARFHALGVPTVEAPLEKIFPASNSARDVRDALLRWALGAGVELRARRRCARLSRRRRVGASTGPRAARSSAGRSSCAPAGAACRRPARPATATPGWPRSACPWSSPCRRSCRSRAPPAWVHELAGISVQDAAVRLCDAAGRTLGRRARPVVFTHRGISGPGAMDLSEPVAPRGVPGLALVLDLLPRVEREALRAGLLEAAGCRRPGARHRAAAPGGRSAAAALLGGAARQAGLEEENPRANALTRAGAMR